MWGKEVTENFVLVTLKLSHRAERALSPMSILKSIQGGGGGGRANYLLFFTKIVKYHGVLVDKLQSKMLYTFLENMLHICSLKICAWKRNCTHVTVRLTVNWFVHTCRELILRLDGNKVNITKICLISENSFWRELVKIFSELFSKIRFSREGILTSKSSGLFWTLQAWMG